MKILWILLFTTTSLYCTDAQKPVPFPRLDLLTIPQRSMYDQISKDPGGLKATASKF